VGDGIDRWIARRIDGWISLTHSSDRVMRQVSHAPGAIIPPPIPDPELAFEPLNPAEVALRYALEPGHFFLYSGNLDAYQELDILAAAAVELAGRTDSPPKIVIASHPIGQPASSPIRVEHPHCGKHDPLAGQAVGWTESMPGIEFRVLESASEMQALLSAARASLVTRRARGGFPIKVVNSLAIGTPIIAFHEQEWGLTHERNSLICASDQPDVALADAIERLASDEILARRLAVGARALYLERHRPEVVAAETLSLIQRLNAFCPR
jgi:glycosyltransferase involved in cell wall biosynthesis